mmetsp:Transcript_80986/g.241324  ORF Transcript_80986/g.241324 Transcript_80986/m.241324 type:complete len:183 (-) Transcript_80986:90-638(-)
MFSHHDESGVVGRRIGAGVCEADPADPYDLRRRFCHTYRQDFAKALREIKNGRKRSCWSWYIFPAAPYVVDGVERGSGTNQQYALRNKPPDSLRGDEAARAYLEFQSDGVNLRECYLEMMTAVAEQLESGISGVDLVGFLDDPKLRSSLRLFESVSRDGHDDEEVHRVCMRALQALNEPPDQ